MDEQPTQEPGDFDRARSERRKTPAAAPRSTAVTEARGEPAGTIRFIPGPQP